MTIHTLAIIILLVASGMLAAILVHSNRQSKRLRDQVVRNLGRRRISTMSKSAPFDLRPGLLGIVQTYGYRLTPAIGHALAVVVRMDAKKVVVRPLGRHHGFVVDKKIRHDEFTPLYAFAMRIRDARTWGAVSVRENLDDAVYLVLELDPEMQATATRGGKPWLWSLKHGRCVEAWLDTGVIRLIDMDQRPESMRDAA